MHQCPIQDSSPINNTGIRVLILTQPVRSLSMLPFFRWPFKSLWNEPLKAEAQALLKVQSLRLALYSGGNYVYRQSNSCWCYTSGISTRTLWAMVLAAAHLWIAGNHSSNKTCAKLEETPTRWLILLVRRHDYRLSQPLVFFLMWGFGPYRVVMLNMCCNFSNGGSLIPISVLRL